MKVAPTRRVRIYCAPLLNRLKKVRSKCAPYAVSFCAAFPAHAWEFIPGLPCLLTHEASNVSVELTFDPTAPLYSISLTRPGGFIPAPVFSIEFVGPSPLTISTDRQQLSTDGKTLTVTDRGFGNVLNGLQFNQSAIARLGDEALTIPLTGASAPVAAFRECKPQAGA